MKKFALGLGLLASMVSARPGSAAEGRIPEGIPRLNHVFVIMMENHGFEQIVGNPNAPFINQYAKASNVALNYFAVGHPSLTNYLEVVGGSNFGVQSDNPPDWHNSTCTPNLASAVPSTDSPPSPAICPISGMGTDAATPAVDTTNETQGAPGENNIDGIQAFPAASHTTGITIADQLAQHHMSWKSYQESLPPSGADAVNVSDGFYTDQTNFASVLPTLTPPLSQADVVALYAAKHDPFVYFRSVQEGTRAGSGLANVVAFEGNGGLYADLQSGSVPDFSFIAPNQCNDQHGRGNAGAFCNFDPGSDGTQATLNPALIYRGDVAVRRIVSAIHQSPAWVSGKAAIVLLWDENDYSLAPNVNRVLLVVDTNYGSAHGVQSSKRYTHFSLLSSLEGAFHLPCLNHACDADAAPMSDLFGGHR